MDLLKELFGNGGEELQTSNSNSSSSYFGGVQPPTTTGHQEKKGHSDGTEQAQLKELQAHPLPLLPADDVPVQSSSSSRQTKCSASSAAETLNPGTRHANRDHVDIRAVPSEMPMYLLAEDEGNEEEILRLLESPEGSPDISRAATATGSHADKSLSLADKVAVKRHSGGWPKGRSRRDPTEVQPPKLPANGYTFFALENRRKAEKECGTKSMPVLSRRLGKMWSDLATEQKMVYMNRAGADRLRYLEDLKKYVANYFKGMNLERAQDYVTQCFAGESDDSILSCRLCHIEFTSLYNKQSHFSGKLHLKTLIENLTEPQHDHCNFVSGDVSSEYGVVSSLEEVARGCHRCYQETFAIQRKINADLEFHAQLQEQYGDAEENRWKSADYLTTLKTKEMLIRKNIRNILQIVRNFQSSMP